MDEEIIPEPDENSETGECLDNEEFSASEEIVPPPPLQCAEDRVSDINVEVSIESETVETKELETINLDVAPDDETEVKNEFTEASELKSKDDKVGVNPEESSSIDGSIQNISNGEQPKTVVNGKKKVKEGKPFSKVVVRRLPPSMTKEIFLDQVSPLPTYDYFYFVPASHFGLHDFSRAYLNFVNQDDLFDFTRTYDNYVFIDSKGHEYPAVVEFAPYQRIPKQRPSRKKDNLMGTIESDPLFVTFKEQLIAEALESSKSANSMKQHYFETEINESEEVKTTPLLEFLKARRAEKIRIREEKKEERKRKEAERKLLKQQKLKEKQLEQDQDQSSEVKIPSLSNNDDEDSEWSSVEVTEYQDSLSQENPQESETIKSEDIFESESSHYLEIEPCKENYQGLKGAKCSHSCSPVRDEDWGGESRSSATKGTRYERSRWGGRRKGEGHSGSEAIRNDGSRGRGRQWWRGGGRNRKPDRSMSEARETTSYRLLSKNDLMHPIELQLSPQSDTQADGVLQSKEKKELKEKDAKKVKTKDKEDKFGKHSSEGRSREFKNKGGKSYKEERLKQAERREEKKKKEIEEVKEGLGGGEEEEAVEGEEKGWGEKKKNSKTGGSDSSKGGRTFRRKEERKREGAAERRRNKMYKGKKESKESLAEVNVKQEAPSDDAQNTTPVTVETANSESQPSNQEPSDTDAKNSDHKPANDPRAQRRIRNKDRPSIEIYRPGMGKFSRQRLEKEKSVTGDSPAHSPSPTPQQ